MNEEHGEQTVALTPVAEELLEVLSHRTGLNRSEVVELAIRRLSSSPDVPQNTYERQEHTLRNQQDSAERTGENPVTGERVYYVPTDRDPLEK